MTRWTDEPPTKPLKPSRIGRAFARGEASDARTNIVRAPFDRDEHTVPVDDPLDLDTPRWLSEAAAPPAPPPARGSAERPRAFASMLDVSLAGTRSANASLCDASSWDTAHVAVDAQPFVEPVPVSELIVEPSVDAPVVRRRSSIAELLRPQTIGRALLARRDRPRILVPLLLVLVAGGIATGATLYATNASVPGLHR